MVSVPRRAGVLVPLLAGSLAFGSLIFLLLPNGVTALNDDFAYYRSVVETLQHHRPWTDDYLEPWAAGLSLLSAGVLRMTASFALATNGLIVVLGALGFLACGRLLVDRGRAPAGAIAFTFLILSFPLLLQTLLEFNGWIVYLPCLVWAVWAAERRCWWCFLVAWLFALSTRQTAIVWGVLPLADAWSTWRKRPGMAASPRLWPPLIVAAVGLVTFAVLTVGMNPTRAQLSLTKPQLLDFGRDLLHLRLGAYAARFAVGVSAGLLAIGLGKYLQGVDDRRQPKWSVGRLGAGLIAFAVLAGFGRHVNITYYGYHGAWIDGYPILIGLIGAAGLARNFTVKVSTPIVLAAVASLAVVCIHAPLNGPYLLETGLLGVFATRPKREPASPAPPIRLMAWLPVAVGVGLMFCHLAWAYDLKLNFDRRLARIRTAEQALRAGQIAIGDLPAGVETLVHWRVLPYLNAASRRGMTPRTFLPTVRTPGRSTRILQSFSPSLRRWPGFADTRSDAAGRVLQQVSFRCGWFFRGELALESIDRRRTPESMHPAGPSDYDPPIFPLNDAEWLDLVRHPSNEKRPPLRPGLEK